MIVNRPKKYALNGDIFDMSLAKGIILVLMLGASV